MRRPAGPARAAALAIFLGALVLMSLVMDDGKNSALPMIVGRRRMSRADGGQRTLEDFKAEDPFQDSKRRVPNGPDPIHNRGTGKSGRSPGEHDGGADVKAASEASEETATRSEDQNPGCIARRRNRHEVHCGGSGLMWGVTRGQWPIFF
ncbi:hypothetical protein EJB05_03959 [Eragrostis curvula]|uniref:Uncharacterized protein n=1 Tax=Eragrostis curvula TaxID=38414 RepID=A0A5J9W9B2_9POAL|nr:hypothetical protein EJB05_03959 [Eragrostis curvula]